MSATSTSRGFAEHHDRAEADRTNPVVRRRRMTALVLTVFAIALGIGLVAAYGRDALVIYFSQLPLALALLWAATRDLRFDERGGEFSERP
ncbi:MAG: hypothetical protein JWP87_346 [Labilithrix sp.]|nr:hypothetical protein [Labilithrix sp.]